MPRVYSATGAVRQSLSGSSSPNGDFARTIVRQSSYSALSVLIGEPLPAPGRELAPIAAKAEKDMCLLATRPNGSLLLRLGDGTEESHGGVKKRSTHCAVHRRKVRGRCREASAERRRRCRRSRERAWPCQETIFARVDHEHATAPLRLSLIPKRRMLRGAEGGGEENGQSPASTSATCRASCNQQSDIPRRTQTWLRAFGTFRGAECGGGATASSAR